MTDFSTEGGNERIKNNNKKNNMISMGQEVLE